MLTEYEKDLERWECDSSGTISKPNKKDYDEFGYKKGTVTYEDGKILDNYLIEIYGIEYARQNPLRKI